MVASGSASAPARRPVSPVPRSAILAAATQSAADVLRGLDVDASGLTAEDAAARLARFGPNAVQAGRAHAGRVLLSQVRSPILLLLFVTAAVSAVIGDTVDAAVIATILVVSIGLGFANEYRAARTAVSLHERIRHRAVVVRAGERAVIDVSGLVPGDLVLLAAGASVPADLRLLETLDLRCDESIVTGESTSVDKRIEPVAGSPEVGDLDCCALMGTVVQSGQGRGVVVATGPDTEFGRIAAGLDRREPQTEFQRGLARFSSFLLVVALILTAGILVANILLGRSWLDALLFSLAIAVGITPQLLPAVVSTSLSAGARSLARRNVLVKRMVCIEDLGDLDLLITDKTGTLTDGRVTYSHPVPAPGVSSDRLTRAALLATDADWTSPHPGTAGLDPLDAALWRGAGGGWAPRAVGRVDMLPFDHDRRMMSVLVTDDGAQRIICKGAPESVLPQCATVPAAAREALDELYRQGLRVVAVADRAATGAVRIRPGDETGLNLLGYVCFVDAPKPGAAHSLARLAALGVDMRIATGDNGQVAERVCEELGLGSIGVMTGAEVDDLDEAALEEAVQRATVFARVSPEQKGRIVSAFRAHGRSVGFLGDGVNDALALHQADVGVSVDSAVDIAKDAADVLLLDKDLGVLADGVVEGRRIFANTMKYVFMGTSSNFGNMFSAAVASLVLPFLPMLPGQILLNNLLYDTSQLAIPTDHADPEQLRTPSHWNIGQIRRFMLVFGPISSLFDFATFALMLGVFHALPPEFRTGWFIESIATQTLIVFAIRTRRVPFLRSRPSVPLVAAVAGVVALAAAIPFTPLAAPLGFAPLPAPFFLALMLMLVGYLVVVEVAKYFFYRTAAPPEPPVRSRGRAHRVARAAGRFRIAADVHEQEASGVRPLGLEPRTH